MSSFTEILIASPLKDGNKWVVRKEFEYYIKEEGGDSVCVPAGFVTDYASIPQVLWTLAPKWGKYGKAAIVHDYLYSTHEKSRKEADDIFYDAMIVLGVPKWKAKTMYRAVRWFGGKSYKKPGSFMISVKDSMVEIPELGEDVCFVNRKF
jgi:hypothetical protein